MNQDPDREDSNQEKDNSDPYYQLYKSFSKALDIYFPKEDNREHILHNAFMIIASYGLKSGCTLQEVLGSFDTAGFELKYLTMFSPLLIDADELDEDSGEFDDT